jgi:hypothetical protein
MRIDRPDGSVVPYSPKRNTRPAGVINKGFLSRLPSHEPNVAGRVRCRRSIAEALNENDSLDHFELVPEIEANKWNYIAGENKVDLTLKVFPLAAWNTLDTLQGRVMGGIGIAPMVSASILAGVRRLKSSPIIQEFISLKERNRNARPNLDSAIKNQLTLYLEGFAPTCNLPRKANGIRPAIPFEIHNELKALSESTGIEKAPLAVWSITDVLAIQPREINGGVGVNDGHRAEMQEYLSKILHDLEIAVRWARAGMDEFDV